MGCLGSKVKDTTQTDETKKRIQTQRENNKTKKKKTETIVQEIKETAPVQTYARFYQSHLGTKLSESDSALRGASFLPNGDLLVADYKNNKLKLFNSAFKFITDVELHSAPWDVCPSFEQAEEAFATVPYKKEVHTVSIETVNSQIRILPVDAFRTEGFCWGITCFDDGLAVSVKVSSTQGPIKEPDYQVHLHRYDGALKRKIIFDTDGVPYFLEPKFLNITYDNLFLLVSDYKQNAVFCINNEDELIFKYTGMNCPNGVTMDEKKNLHITSFFGTERVQKIGANGKYVDGLKYSEDRPLFPHSICYRQRDRIIVLTTDKSLEIYRLV